MFELKKSFGAIVNGKHELWAAGDTFTPGEDDAVIEFLASNGAEIEPVETEIEPVETEIEPVETEIEPVETEIEPADTKPRKTKAK